MLTRIQENSEKALIDSTPGMTLFLADNDEINLLAHRKIAQASGFFTYIRSATDGLGAFDLINLASEGGIPFPDIFLFDLDLRVLNGITLLKVLHKANIEQMEKMSLVVLSAPLPDDTREIAHALGVSAFLTKPLTPESLKSIVKSRSRKMLSVGPV